MPKIQSKLQLKQDTWRLSDFRGIVTLYSMTRELEDFYKRDELLLVIDPKPFGFESDKIVVSNTLRVYRGFHIDFDRLNNAGFLSRYSEVQKGDFELILANSSGLAAVISYAMYHAQKSQDEITELEARIKELQTQLQDAIDMKPVLRRVSAMHKVFQKPEHGEV